MNSRALKLGGVVVVIIASTFFTSLERNLEREPRLRSRLLWATITTILFGYALHEEKEKKSPSKTPTENKLDEHYTTEPLLKLVRNANKHPHINIIEKTGGGKSTLAQYIASQLSGKVFVSDPHFEKGSNAWLCADGVVGVGRNFTDGEDQEVLYNDVVSNVVESPTCLQVLNALEQEMTSRYRSPVPYKENEQHTWIIDEATTTAGNLKTDFKEAVKPILFESRKVGIRLILLTQSDQVKTLHLQGEGAVRNQFTYIYLREAGLKWLEKNKRKKEADYLRTVDFHWCLIDGTVSRIPLLEEIEAVVSERRKPERFVARFPGENEVDFRRIIERGKATPEELEIISRRIKDYVGRGYTTICEQCFGITSKRWMSGNRTLIEETLALAREY